MTCDDAADALSLIALLTYSLLFNADTVTNLRLASNCRGHHLYFSVSTCCVLKLRVARLRAMAQYTNNRAAGESRNHFGDNCK
jgi:hypothetical protein